MITYSKQRKILETVPHSKAVRMIATKKRLVNKHTKHSERHYALSVQLQNSSEARRQMISGFQQVKGDTKMSEVQEKASTSMITKLNAALNPTEEEEDQESTQKGWQT